MNDPAQVSRNRGHGNDRSQDGPARVALIPYLNSAPYFLRWSDLEKVSEGRWAPIVLPPRQLGHAAEEGTVDAGLLPVADLFRLEKTFEPLRIEAGATTVSLGIANRGRVDSVLLFVRGERGTPPQSDLLPEDLAPLDGGRIAVTSESSTSARLLRLLLEVRFGVHPRAYERLDPAAPVDGALGGANRFVGTLVIGDAALRWRHRPPDGWFQGMDLACAWQDWTGLPFVFACWGVRRTVSAAARQCLGRLLEASLTEASTRLSDLVRDRPRDLGTPEELTRYLEQFTYRLGPLEMLAADRFRALLDEHGIPCTRD